MRELETPWSIKRELKFRLDAETDQRYGCRPDDRPVEAHIKYGFVNLDKPSGPSSHEVTAWAKRILGVGHAGHAGTLEAYAREILV